MNLPNGPAPTKQAALGVALPVVEVSSTSGHQGPLQGVGPDFGGYSACMVDVNVHGEGETIDRALDSLASRLREHVEAWDADRDFYVEARRELDRINHFEEPELVTWAREALRSAQLLALLRMAADRAAMERQ